MKCYPALKILFLLVSVWALDFTILLISWVPGFHQNLHSVIFFGGRVRGHIIGKYLDLCTWLFFLLFSSFLVVLMNSVLIYTAITQT
jgi:hypothetical protein